MYTLQTCGVTSLYKKGIHTDGEKTVVAVDESEDTCLLPS